MRFAFGSNEVFGVGDLLQSIDVLADQGFGDGDVSHRRGRRRAVPMPVAGRAADNVSRPDLGDRFAFRLGPATAGGDDQALAERMGQPSAARAGREGDIGVAVTELFCWAPACCPAPRASTRAKMRLSAAFERLSSRSTLRIGIAFPAII